MVDTTDFMEVWAYCYVYIYIYIYLFICQYYHIRTGKLCVKQFVKVFSKFETGNFKQFRRPP
jgi:hypothetical protein